MVPELWGVGEFKILVGSPRAYLVRQRFSFTGLTGQEATHPSRRPWWGGHRPRWAHAVRPKEQDSAGPLRATGSGNHRSQPARSGIVGTDDFELRDEDGLMWKAGEFGRAHQGRPGALLADGSEPEPLVFDIGSSASVHRSSDWWFYTRAS